MDDDWCKDLYMVHEDAIAYFTIYRGEQKTGNNLFGSYFYNDYKIRLWDPEKVQLTEAVDLGCNIVEYTYTESETLAGAKEVFDQVVQKFLNCKLHGYELIDHADKTSLARAHFIDNRDKDAFLFYKWPEFDFSITNVSGKYAVKLRVMSKKFD
jgi:hypothetical protein